MGISIKGFVLEPPRVGAANNPYTYTPNNAISDSAAFTAAYPQDESAPRADYLVLVLQDGQLIDARFGWTKNQVIQRFDYDVLDQRFKPLRGAPVEAVGVVGPDINTDGKRLQILAPVQPWPAAPYRLSVGPLPGTGLTLSLVTAFGSPAVGTVEVLTTDGTLNWNPADLTAYDGWTVQFQRQQFYTAQETTGAIGAIDETLYLNPLPATGQFPLLRIGFGLWLEPIEVGAPASGQVRWDAATGALTFNAADVAANVGKPVYYDGVLLGYNLALPVWDLGALPGSGTVTLPVLPAAGGELVFRIRQPGPLTIPPVQFPVTTRLDASAALDPRGKAGYVQVKPSGGGGLAQFSRPDVNLYLGMTVECISGDLLLEAGITLRLFRCSANLDGTNSQLKDVTGFYTVEDATLADPMIGSPLVSLPAVPIDGDPARPIKVKVTQGIGSFLSNDFPRLDGATEIVTPGVTLGYTLNFDSRQLNYAQRKVWDGASVPDLPIEIPSGAVALPDPLLSPTFLRLSLDTGSGFQPLTVGEDALVDLLGGVVSFTATSGAARTTYGGGHATFSGTTLTDVPGAFADVLPGDLVVIPSEPSQAVYTVIAVQHGVDTLTTDVAWDGPALSDVDYVVYRGLNDPMVPTRLGREVLADRFWSEAEPIDPDTKVERIRTLGAIPAPPSYLSIPTPFRYQQNVWFADSVTVTVVPNSSKFTVPLPAGQVEVSLATGELNLTRAELASPRFRFGEAVFSSKVELISGAFTNPALLPSQHVEINLVSGECNFSGADVSKTTAWVRNLRRKVDYRMIAHLGFIEFTERMMIGEEALITYAPLVDGVAQPLVQERATWIIRKEKTPARAMPTSSVLFNPAGRRVASDPAPAVFRGGRPQDSTQVKIDPSNSVIAFQSDKILTNVLPHGPTVGTDENIYIDYYVYDAVGGEKTTTVLHPPLALATVSISEDAESFTVQGDQTSVYPAGYLLRVESDDVYLIGTSVYDGVLDETTVTLAYGAVFRNSANDPKLYVASGPTPLTSLLWRPSYFRTEAASYDTVARGMNVLNVSGDRTTAYRAGTVVAFRDAAWSFFDTLLISGATYDAEKDRTVVTFTQNALRQYTSGTHTLLYCVRPLLDSQTKQAQTARTPILAEPYLLYRRQATLAGRLLSKPQDYSIDDSGVVQITSGMLPGEELVILYTGHRIVPAGSTLRYAYTSTIVPTDQNGLLNQILTTDYGLFSPDTFYCRVEKLTSFQAEVAGEFEQEAKGNSPSGGPTTSNASQPKLWEQGRESLFFAEGHLANSDIVMRAYLKFFNDACNYLEDVLQDIDGRMVGDVDGRLKFDGKLDNPVRLTWADVTNQIDDVLKVSDFPFTLGPIPPFPPALNFVGTYQKCYLPGRWSRFFPTYRASLSSFTNVPGGSKTGTEIGDLGWKNLVSTDPTAFWRLPRAALLRSAKTGDTKLYVDNAIGASDPVVRPPFLVGMKLVAADRTTVYIDGENPPGLPPITVTAPPVAPAPGNMAELIVSALPCDLPAGTTVYLCTTGPNADQTNQRNYRVGTDVKIDLGGGKLIYVEEYFPFLKALPLIPVDLCVQEVGSGECLQVSNVSCNNLRLAPYRFPALDGKNISDCGDQAVPMFITTENEGTANTNEANAITALQAATVPTQVISNGALDALGTTITVAAIPAPAIQQYDLVRILTGGNAGAGFRRVLSVTPTTITVDAPFPVIESGFDFFVTAGADVAVGAFTVIGTSPTVLQANGTLPVAVGQTVIITNGGPGSYEGQRRQITQVVFDSGPPVVTKMTLDADLVGGAGSTTFRVSKHVATFGPLTALAGFVNDLRGILLTNDIGVPLPTSIASEIKAIDRLMDGNPPEGTEGILTDIFSPATLTGTVEDPGSAPYVTLSSPSDLTQANNPVYYVFIRSGANMGLYSIVSATATAITINGSFIAPGPVTFRVVSVFGFSKPGLQDIMCVLKVNQTFLDDADTFYALVTTLVPVTALPADPSAFATGVTTDLLIARATQLASRDTAGLIDTVSGLMTSKEKLYDKRYTWIDARINTKTGKQARVIQSILDRVTKSEEQKASLLKKALIDQLLKPQLPSEAEEKAPKPTLCP